MGGVPRGLGGGSGPGVGGAGPRGGGRGGRECCGPSALQARSSQLRCCAVVGVFVVARPQRPSSACGLPLEGAEFVGCLRGWGF